MACGEWFFWTLFTTGAGQAALGSPGVHAWLLILNIRGLIGEPRLISWFLAIVGFMSYLINIWWFRRKIDSPGQPPSRLSGRSIVRRRKLSRVIPIQPICSPILHIRRFSGVFSEWWIKKRRESHGRLRRRGPVGFSKSKSVDLTGRLIWGWPGESTYLPKYPTQSLHFLLRLNSQRAEIYDQSEL